jgi:Ni/Co efflux regulator RcnB
MKRALLTGALIAAMLSPVAAQAQNGNRERQETRQDNRQDRRDDRREARQDQRNDQREWRQDNRNDRREARQDHREDWQRWRESNRNDFRRGKWNAPFRYRSFSAGVVAPRSYWSSRYYVNNWSAYRLPRPAYSYYRYVRHYDDLLLINTRNGRIVRVFNNFYW